MGHGQPLGDYESRRQGCRGLFGLWRQCLRERELRSEPGALQGRLTVREEGVVVTERRGEEKS